MMQDQHAFMSKKLRVVQPRSCSTTDEIVKFVKRIATWNVFDQLLQLTPNVMVICCPTEVGSGLSLR